jgi:hypothetical protein
VEVLAETISENYRASPCYRAGLRDDIRKDRRPIKVTEFTSSILATTDRSWHQPSQGLRPGESNQSLGVFVVVWMLYSDVDRYAPLYEILFFL